MLYFKKFIKNKIILSSGVGLALGKKFPSGFRIELETGAYNLLNTTSFYYLGVSASYPLIKW